MVPELGLRVLGSGSSGNASLVSAGASALLVEAGLSCRRLEARIAAAGRSPEEISAVLVSHEHGDHCQGAASFAVRHRVPVACTAGTWAHLAPRAGAASPDWLPLAPGRPRNIGAFRVTGFSTPHDAAEPVGFRIEAGGAAAVLVTDLGHLSASVTEAVEGASVFLVESNYDEELLYRSRYPLAVRQRIASSCGHLSNGALALYLRRALPASVNTILLAHLSENTNTPELAFDTARTALAAAGRSGVRLLVASRQGLAEEIRVGPAAGGFPRLSASPPPPVQRSLFEVA